MSTNALQNHIQFWGVCNSNNRLFNPKSKRDITMVWV